MKPFVFALIILAVAVAAIILASRSGSESKPSNRPLFGYYGCFGNQVAEVAGHTSLHWEAFWEGDDRAIENIRAANCFTVLDVGRIFERLGPKQIKLRANAEELLRELFDKLQAAGVLPLVLMIVPHDEPNLPENQACADLPRAVSIIQAVAVGYPELSGVLLGCIYYAKTPRCHTELFDVVGYDDYPRGAEMLAPDGDYETWRQTLKPGQRTMLVPGGSFGQDPRPFIEYAQWHPEVLAVVPFLWRNPGHGEDLTGIADIPAMRDAYVAAGLNVKGEA